jgi:hypothetical protein
VIRKGQHFRAVSQEMANTELLYSAATMAYDTLIQGVDENGGYNAWEEEAEDLAPGMETCQAEWEIGCRLLSTADGGLKVAFAAHETACGADARSAATLSELVINRKS